MGVGLALGIAGAATAAAGTGLSIAQASRTQGGAPGLQAVLGNLQDYRRRRGEGWHALDTRDALLQAALSDRLAQLQLFGGGAQSVELPFQSIDEDGRRRTAYQRFNVPGSEGLLAMMARAQPEMFAMQRAEEEERAGLTTALLSQFGPQLMEVGRAFDPDRSALSDALVADARSHVGDGGSPLEDRELQQSVRAAQAARGMGYGQVDLAQEAIAMDRGREDRRMRRGDYASRILGLRSATTAVDPLATLMGIRGGSSGAGSLAQQVFGRITLPPGLGSAATVGVAGGLEQEAYAADQSARNQQANNLASILGSSSNLALQGSRTYAAFNNNRLPANWYDTFAREAYY